MNKQATKLLSIVALALFASALFAGAAQAETEPPEWMINGNDVTLANPLQAEIQVKEIEALEGTTEHHASLLTEVSGLAINILCTEASLKEVETLPHGELTHGFVEFHGCKFYVNGEEQEACEPLTNLGGGVIDHGLIITNRGKGYLALHEGKLVTVIESLVEREGMPDFVDIETGEECAFGEEVPVLGKLVLEDPKFEKVEQVEHLITEEPALTELFAFTLEHAASIDGSALVELAGPHKGLVWRGLGG